MIKKLLIPVFSIFILMGQMPPNIIIDENEKDVIEKVLRGTFCIFDIVTQRDVRVEIQIPGGTQVYAIDQYSEEHHEIIHINEWNNVFMSSVLRSLDSQNLPCPAMRVIRELSTPENFKEFLQVAQNIFIRECKLVYENAYGTLAHSNQGQ